MDYRFSLADCKELLKAGPGGELFCLYRKNGEKCYPLLQNALSQVKEGGVFRLVVPPEAVVDYSFIDETVGRLRADLGLDECGVRYLVVEVADHNQFDTVRASFVMRRLFGLVIEEGRPQLVGLRDDDKRRGELEETLMHLNMAGRMTATELARIANLELTAANMRLKRLFDARLARRERNSQDPRQFIYISLA